MKIIPRFDWNWSADKGRYVVQNKLTGEVIDDSIEKFDEAKTRAEALNQEARKAAGVEAEIELPFSYYGGSRNKDKAIEVVTPTIHR